MRKQRRTSLAPLKVLVIDVGGTNVKVLGTGRTEPLKIPSSPTMTANNMVGAVKRAVAGCGSENGFSRGGKTRRGFFIPNRGI